ncbi:hypothetical protein Ahia01_000155900, partial [Argonauta hians]
CTHRSPPKNSMCRPKDLSTSGRHRGALSLASWNVRTMLDSNSGSRPQRRSALVARELSRLGIDIAALSEVRFPDEGSLREQGAGYTLFWSGRPATERRLSGVGFMIRSNIASRLENMPTGHSDRIMSLRLPLRDGGHATLFSVYAPTLQADPEESSKFYSGLRSCLQSTPPGDKVIILGDFNARVGRDADAWRGVLGRHGVGGCNSNGRLLLELCAEQQLTITNTVFQQRDMHKCTWMHPRSGHWHLIDYVIVRQRDLRDVLHTRVMRSAECHTDHRLVRCRLRLAPQPRPRGRGRGRTQPAGCKKFNLEKLQSTDVGEALQAGLKFGLENITRPRDSSPDTLWAQLKTTILRTSEEVLGYSTRKNGDWFDDNDLEIQQLLASKRSSHQAFLAHPRCPVRKAAFRQACADVQRRLRLLKNEWWTDHARKTQLCADRGDFGGFFKALRLAYGPTPQARCTLRSSDSEVVLTDKSSILRRWSEHFQTLFDADRTVQASALARIPQRQIRLELDCPPSLEEVTAAIKRLKFGKAVGADGIPPEIWKAGGPMLHARLHELLVCCWEKGVLPSDL